MEQRKSRQPRWTACEDSNSCQKFGRRKCHNAAFGEIAYIAGDDVVCVDALGGDALNGILEIGPMQRGGFGQIRSGKVCKLKDETELLKGVLDFLRGELFAHDVDQIGERQCGNIALGLLRLAELPDERGLSDEIGTGQQNVQKDIGINQ